jgi:O-antigen/teichoic acid export membrane protein
MKKLLSSSPLARNAWWMSLGQALRLVIQALYFIEIARSLGVRNYGAFVGVVALVGIIYPFGSLGSGSLLLKSVARDKNLFSSCWGKALATTVVFGSMLLVVVLAVSRLALPAEIPVRLVALVAVSDIFGLNIISVAGQAFQAFDRLIWTASINVMISMGRLVGAVILIAIYPHPSALQWGYIYLGGTVVVATIAVLLVSKILGFPRFNWRRSRDELREGFYFSASQTAQTIYNDIDKTMLARLGTLEATGVYGAAYRLIDVSFIPVSALLSSALPNFFRSGVDGISSSLAYAKPLLLRGLKYAGLIGVILLLSANVVPHILGAEYAPTAQALRWLAVLPALKVLHRFLSDALTGAGYQGLRTCIQVCVAIFNVLINLWLIPRYSWRGAAWSSIASDAALACAIGAAAFVLSRRSRMVLVGAATEVSSDRSELVRRESKHKLLGVDPVRSSQLPVPRSIMSSTLPPAEHE